MLVEFINAGRQVLIDDRGEVVNIGRRCWLNQRRADELERIKPGSLTPVAAPAESFSGVASATPSPPKPDVVDVMPEDLTEADEPAESEPEAEELEPEANAPTVEQELALHHSKRKRIAKEVTGRKLGASKADGVIRGLSPEQLAEVATKYITEG